MKLLRSVHVAHTSLSALCFSTRMCTVQRWTNLAWAFTGSRWWGIMLMLLLATDDSCSRPTLHHCSFPPPLPNRETKELQNASSNSIIIITPYPSSPSLISPHCGLFCIQLGSSNKCVRHYEWSFFFFLPISFKFVF